ncbi:MAG TPA: hypothetical protein VGD26_14085 [Chitinophagaceae bacterium]
MTKIVKWWMKFSFWNKLRAIMASLGIGGEVALYFGDSNEVYKWVAAGATILSILITYIVEDANKNGIADIFEDDGKK